MTFKPMLAFSKLPDLTKLRYPILCSKKLDGVRATVQGGTLLSRSLKPLPNKSVQTQFRALPEGVDGELIYGDPCSPSAYRDTVSIVMSDDKPATGVRLHVFDKFSDHLDFRTRLDNARYAVSTSGRDSVVYVEHTAINSLEELEAYEGVALEAGYEGVMIRSYMGPYKQGRSTEAEGYLLKLKRYEECEATILGMYEQEHNDNPAMTNELGRTARSSCKAGKVGAGVLGGFFVEAVNGDYKGVQFKVGCGFDAAQRESFWGDNSLCDRIIKVKYFPTGSKDKPRHPVFLGFRSAEDMS